jgi:hypothetical protein
MFTLSQERLSEIALMELSIIRLEKKLKPNNPRRKRKR